MSQLLATTTTPEPPRTLEQLEAVIEKGKEAFERVGLAIAEVMARKLYLQKYGSFEEYCKKRWGWSREHGYRLARAAKFMTEQRLIAEKSGEPSQAVANESQARMLIRQARALRRGETIEVETVTKTQMSARVDPNHPVQMVVPLAPPAENKLAPDVVVMIQQASRFLDKLMRDNLIASNPDFRHACALIFKVKELVQPEFNFARGVTSRQKSRGTVEQVIEFCENIGLTKEDGIWFFQKCEGCGWKNNKAPIVDWRMTVRAWEALRTVFPSHKRALATPAVNGHPVLSGAEMIVRQKELEDCQKQIDTIKNSYDSHQSMRSADRERLGKLANRRKELHAILGRQV